MSTKLKEGLLEKLNPWFMDEVERLIREAYELGRDEALDKVNEIMEDGKVYWSWKNKIEALKKHKDLQP